MGMKKIWGEVWRDATERWYWAGDDHRWGKPSTTFSGFWLLAAFDRLFYPIEKNRIARHRRMAQSRIMR